MARAGATQSGGESVRRVSPDVAGAGIVVAIEIDGGVAPGIVMLSVAASGYAGHPPCVPLLWELHPTEAWLRRVSPEAESADCIYW